MAMRTAINTEGITIDLDLDSKSGFPMMAGRNSVELAYQDSFGREKYFNYLLDFASAAASPEGPNHARPQEHSGRLFLLVVGIAHFQDGPGAPTNLQFADRDAQSVLDFFRSPQGGGVRPEETLLLLNEQATHEAVHRALFQFLARPGEQDTVVIYFAGHGAPDVRDPRNVYLMTADARSYNLSETAFPMYELQEVFAHVLKARRVVTLMDTCHAQGMTGVKAQNGGSGDGSETNNLINQYIEHFAGQGERAVITASDINEVSLEGPQWGKGHGVFTYYLLRGLAGDADSNHDGIVTAGEIFAYLRKMVSRETNGRQHPRTVAGFASSLILSRLTPGADHLASR